MNHLWETNKTKSCLLSRSNCVIAIRKAIMILTLVSRTPSVTSPISDRMARESGSPSLAADLGLSLQNSLYKEANRPVRMVITQSWFISYSALETYQVLHLFLQPCQGLPSTHSKHICIHVFIIHCHFYLLGSERKTKGKD